MKYNRTYRTTIRHPLLLLASMGFAMVCSVTFAATPTSGTLSQANQMVTWTGGPLVPTAASTCGGPANPACDNFALTIMPPSFGFKVKITLTASAADDYDLEVYGPTGTLAASSGSSAGSPEIVQLLSPAAGTYTVSASPYAPVGPYTAVAEIIADSSGGPPPAGGPAITFLNSAPTGAQELDPTWQHFSPTFGANGLGLTAGEPTFGIPSVHNIALQATSPTKSRAMYIASLQTLRATYDDCTVPSTVLWEDKSVPTHATTLDPILQVDSQTGRTFSSQLIGATTLMSFSDDEGENWTPSQGAGSPAGADHQTFGTGRLPPNDPIGGVGYDNAVYYASQSVATAFGALSRNGGLTFGPGVPMWNITQCGGLHGHVQVSPLDGTAYTPNGNCGGEAGVAVTEDAGTTWTVRTAPGTPGGPDPGVGVGSDGTVYLGTCSNDKTPLITVSTNKGQSWTAPINVGAGVGIQNCAFPTVAAGDGDRAAFAFVGSSDPGPGTGTDPLAFTGSWFMYVAVTYDRGVTWTTSIASPGDPVQRGTICLGGTLCDSNRNLLDFNDINVDEKGRILVAYSDGCTGSCVTGGANSGTDVARIARQQPGTKGLYAAFDNILNPAPKTPSSPYVLASSFVNTVEVTWSVPFNGNQPITSYQIFRAEGTGPFPMVPLATVPFGTNSYTDSAIVSGSSYRYRVLSVNSFGSSPQCFEAPVQAPVILDPCTLPGVLRAQDAMGDQMGTPALDIEKLFIAEPFLGDPTMCATPSPNKIVFNLKQADGATAVPNNAFVILWNREFPGPDPTGLQTYDRNMVNMRITAAGPECHFGKATAPSVNGGTDITTLAAADCILRPDGNITIRVPYSVVDDCMGTGCSIAPGYSLPGLEVRVYANNVSGQPVSQGTAQDFSKALSYTLAGNNACRVNNAPTANPDQKTIDASGTPVVINVLANDVANDCDTLSTISATNGTVGATMVNGTTTVTYSPLNANSCSDLFTYKIGDGNGNFAQSTVQIIGDGHCPVVEAGDVLFRNGFDSAPSCSCPTPPPGTP
ncbi:MAG: Ig-like domain-containing protein [Dokdonella sp.]